MICYLRNFTEEQLQGVNAYWHLADPLNAKFTYAADEIGSISGRYMGDVAPFFPRHPAFICEVCSTRMPARNRSQYYRAAKGSISSPVLCEVCRKTRREHETSSAQMVVDEFSGMNFDSLPYIESLNLDEVLALMSLLTELRNDDLYLGSSPEEVSITGVTLLDQRLHQSLIEKGALVYVGEVPSEVKSASRILYSDNRQITYDDDNQALRYFNAREGALTAGVYILVPKFKGKLSASNIGILLHQRLQTFDYTLEEVAIVKQIVKEIQLGKLYQMVVSISREYALPIANSNTLGALLDHLAEHYSPREIYFTFRAKGKDAVLYAHKENAPHYRVRHYFSKTIGDYIQYIEEKGWGLKKTWRLPSAIQLSPFETHFSELYLKGYFDWGRLSTKEVIATWLNNSCISVNLESTGQIETGSK